MSQPDLLAGGGSPASHRLYGGNRAKGPFGQNRVNLADPEVGLEGCGGDLEAESGLFGPNWPGVGSTCRGGWGPIFGSWGSDHENRAKIDPTKNLEF